MASNELDRLADDGCPIFEQELPSHEAVESVVEGHPEWRKEPGSEEPHEG